MHSVQTDLADLERHSNALTRLRAATEMPMLLLRDPLHYLHPYLPPNTVQLIVSMGKWSLVRHALTGASWVETARLRPIARRLTSIDGGRA